MRLRWTAPSSVEEPKQAECGSQPNFINNFKLHRYLLLAQWRRFFCNSIQEPHENSVTLRHLGKTHVLIGQSSSIGKAMGYLRSSARMCWRAPNSSDVVLFHAHYDREFIPHTHDAATVLILTDGEVELGVGRDTYHMRKGDLALIGAHQIHSAKPFSAQGWTMRSIHLPPSLIAEATGMPEDDCARMHFTNPAHHGLMPVGSEFLDLHRCTEAMGTSCGDLREFVKYLYAQIDIFGPQFPSDQLDERVVQAKKIITETVCENIHINAIADAVGLSVFSLIRQFQKAFGLSPHAWRMQARANEAARLLRDRNHAAETAALCGFSDQSHMARTFKKVYGITPGQYCTMH